MEKQPNSKHQQSVPIQQNIGQQTTQAAESSIPQIIHQPFTLIRTNQHNQAHLQTNKHTQVHLLDYDTNIQDKQTREALKLFKTIFNDKQQWNLSSKKWLRLKLQKVFENLSLALPKKIDLTKNQEPLLLDSLACVTTFPCLKELRLCNNKISSFEKLTFIDFSVLEDLSLSDNDIIGIKCLNKMNFRPENIRKVAFYANRIQSLDPISRVTFVNTNPKQKSAIKGEKAEENLLQSLQLQRQVADMGYQKDLQSQQLWRIQQKQQLKIEEKVKEEKALQPLSLLFGINQIGSMQEINKLQRQAIKPKEIKGHKMGDYWDNDSSYDFEAQNYKKNRRLIFSIEMNRYLFNYNCVGKNQSRRRTVFNINYNYFCRNYLPHDNIFS